MIPPRERAYIEPRVRGQEFTYAQFDAATGKRRAVGSEGAREPAAPGQFPEPTAGEGGSKVQDIARAGPLPQSKTQRRKF